MKVNLMISYRIYTPLPCILGYNAFLASTCGPQRSISPHACLPPAWQPLQVTRWSGGSNLLVQGCGTFAVSAWATHVAAARGNDVPVWANYRPIFITIGVTFWSLRLAGFLFYRILQTKTDKYASYLCACCKSYEPPDLSLRMNAPPYERPLARTGPDHVWDGTFHNPIP